MMNEINAWGAYESGTTQTARRFDGGTLRQRRPRAEQGRTRETLVPFGTDDRSLKKEVKDNKDGPEEHVDNVKDTKEFKEVRDIGRSVFRVYFDFSGDNCEGEDDLEPTLLKKVDGTMAWLPVFMNGMGVPHYMTSIILFIEASFRGIAQVFFQNNPLSGMLILAAMFVQSSRVAIHGMIAIICGNLTGRFMGFDESLLSCGLFGYNSFLVGLAIATFDDDVYSWTVLVGVVVTSYLSSVLFVMFGKILAPYKTPPFTLPFNISMLAFLLAMKQIAQDGSEVDEESYVAEAEAIPVTAKVIFAGTIRGIGQVFLANNIISGALVLFGIMLCSRISALAALSGSFIGTVVAALVGEEVASVENGMYGFNPSLTFTAMVMFYVPSLGSMSFGLVASVITIFIQLALKETLRGYELPFMTLPFCLAALVFIVIQGTTSSVISVPLSSMTTPEDHLFRVKQLSAGFDLLFRAIRSSSHKLNRRSLFINYKRSHASTMINSVLQEYEEEVHGQSDVNGLFSRLKQVLGVERDPSRDTRSVGQSFRITDAFKNEDANFDDKLPYHRMFTYIDDQNEYRVTICQFEAFLRSIKFDDEIGINFALGAFDLLDLDHTTSSMDLDNFVAFSKVSRSMPAIRGLVVKFFDFVDDDGDRAVTIEELNSAIEYLNLPAISKDDGDSLKKLCNNKNELEFDVIVNFVTIFKLKTIIRKFQSERAQGFSLDESLHSSLNL